MIYADLHTHTTASDGTIAPEALPALAESAGLKAIAITDHDTISGVEKAKAAAAAIGLEVIAGIEISTDYLEHDVHVLGYYINTASPELKPVLDWSIKEKDVRNEKIVSALQKGGFDISLSELVENNPGTVIGRPHIAVAMIEKGYVSSVDEAFARYLGDGKPYFCPRQRLPLEDAVKFIIKAGGRAVLAHPLQYGFVPDNVKEMVRFAKEHGVSGIEVNYPGYNGRDRKLLLSLAARFDLIPTGGSDFHGGNKPNIALGSAGVDEETVRMLMGS